MNASGRQSCGAAERSELWLNHKSLKNRRSFEDHSRLYWWCACGQSKNAPFCDGSHKARLRADEGGDHGGKNRGLVRLAALE